MSYTHTLCTASSQKFNLEELAQPLGDLTFQCNHNNDVSLSIYIYI